MSAEVREVPFKPLPKQEEFIFSKASQTLLSGSFGAGKSRCGCERGLYLNQKYPGNRGLVIRKSLKDVKKSTIEQTLFAEVLPDSHIVNHSIRDCAITHKTGTTDPSGEPVHSEIHYYGVDGARGGRSDDDLPEKIGSTSWGWIFVDEGTELELGEWTQLLGRLRYKGKIQNGYRFKVPFRPIFTATNPDSPQHWMYDWFRPDDPGDGKGRVVKMNVNDNHHLPQDYVDRMKSSFSGMYYERYIEGEWVGAEGMVYDEFDARKHVVGPDDLPESERWTVHGTETHDDLSGETSESVYVTPPEDWEVYRSIDFGYRDPFVCHWYARSPDPHGDDTVVLFRELYQSEEIVEDLAKRIKALTPKNSDVVETYADHDIEQAEVLKRHGVPSTPATKDIESGIQSVKSRLMLDAEREPQFYVLQGARAHGPDENLDLDDRPKKTLSEFYNYEWEDDDEEPVDEDNHGMDALRYFVRSLYGGPGIPQDELDEWEELFNEGW